MKFIKTTILSTNTQMIVNPELIENIQELNEGCLIVFTNSRVTVKETIEELYNEINIF